MIVKDSHGYLQGFLSCTSQVLLFFVSFRKKCMQEQISDQKLNQTVFDCESHCFIVENGRLLVYRRQGWFPACRWRSSVNEATEEASGSRSKKKNLALHLGAGQLAFIVENRFEQAGIYYHNIEFLPLFCGLARRDAPLTMQEGIY